MKILMVWDGNYPWDVRVEKILSTLNSWGYETHLVCRNSNAKPRKEVINGTTIWRLFAFGSSSLAPLNPAINFPAFFSPIWRHEIKKAINAIQPDVIIIRDLPIALAVIPLAKRAKIPTILDMAECYPELIRCVWKFDRFEFSNLLVRNPYFADAVEKNAIHNVDLIWAMIEEAAERLNKMGVPSEKIVKVSNTPPIPTVNPSVPQRPDHAPLNIVYIGLINPSRGVATLVQAANILRQKGINFHIKIVGSGKDFKRIENMVAELDIASHVELTGWIDHKKLHSILDASDVGLVPHLDCSHWNSTIPNKLFDYMKSAIPVVVSDVKPASRLVNLTQCGLVFRSGDANDLAEKLAALGDTSVRLKMGQAGLNAVNTEFNWFNDSARLKESMLKLVASR